MAFARSNGVPQATIASKRYELVAYLFSGKIGWRSLVGDCDDGDDGDDGGAGGVFMLAIAKDMEEMERTRCRWTNPVPPEGRRAQLAMRI